MATVTALPAPAFAEDGVREMHGCICNDSDGKLARVEIVETTESGEIWLEFGYDRRRLTPKQARYIAGRLYRLARRIDARKGESR